MRSKRFVFLSRISKDCFDSFGHLNFFFQLGLKSLFFQSPPLSISFFVFYTTEREELVQQLDKKPKSTSKEVLLSMAALLLLLHTTALASFFSRYQIATKKRLHMENVHILSNSFPKLSFQVLIRPSLQRQKCVKRRFEPQSS